MKTTLLKSMSALLVLATLSITGCADKSENATLPLPIVANFNNLRAKALQDITQKITFKAEDGLSYVSPKGTKVSINANCLRTQSGDLVTGDVDLFLVEMFDKGNMVVTNKPLMGKDNIGNLLPLVTGGQYNIQVKKGDQVLKPGCIINVSVDAANTGGFDDLMTLWEGNIDSNGDLAWDEVGRDNQKEAGMQGNKETASYNIWGNTFGWTNVDRFYSDSRPKTQIKVTVPGGYNNQNASVYLAYQGEPNVLAQMDTYDLDEHYFSEHYGFIPVGMVVHVIFVSESNGSVAYAIKTATIVNNGVIAIQESDIDVSTLAQVINQINGLN